RATYYGMVTEVDAQLGRLINRLKAWQLYDDTLIVVTSDHGEMLGDHWVLGKECAFEQAYNIPLIVRDPSVEADATRGAHVTHFTEAVDLMPTILQWAGAGIPRQCDGARCWASCAARRLRIGAMRRTGNTTSATPGCPARKPSWACPWTVAAWRRCAPNTTCTATSRRCRRCCTT